MKIVEITEIAISFNNGNTISYDHWPNGSEWNYADFQQLNDLAKSYEFNEYQMNFDFIENQGFRFGDNNQMYFVPCYSIQNGRDTCNIEIYYNDERVCYGKANLIKC